MHFDIYESILLSSGLFGRYNIICPLPKNQFQIDRREKMEQIRCEYIVNPAYDYISSWTIVSLDQLYGSASD